MGRLLSTLRQSTRKRKRKKILAATFAAREKICDLSGCDLHHRSPLTKKSLFLRHQHCSFLTTQNTNIKSSAWPSASTIILAINFKILKTAPVPLCCRAKQECTAPERGHFLLFGAVFVVLTECVQLRWAAGERGWGARERERERSRKQEQYKKLIKIRRSQCRAALQR